ncbi:hypothetical protein MCEMSEM23_01668 [Rhabdaerophilaceae bacterium]
MTPATPAAPHVHAPATVPREASPIHDDFWVASGHHLVDRGESGGLIITDAFLRAYLARPELVPPPEACPVERGLHASLLAEPRRTVPAQELALVADADARENLGFFLTFRDLLLSYASLEAAYVALIEAGTRGLPPIFVQHLTHVIARNAFDDEADGWVLRAAECFFRPQRITFHEGRLLLADDETIDSHEHDRKHSPLLSMLGGPAVSELEILNDQNGAQYRARSDAHDFVLDLTDLKAGRAAFGRAMTRWIAHLTGIHVEFEPVDAFSGADFAWFLSLDQDGTVFANKVWNGKALSPEDTSRVLALFTFMVPDHPRIQADKRGARAFAVLGSGTDRVLRVKAQNLIAGLPLAKGE